MSSFVENIRNILAGTGITLGIMNPDSAPVIFSRVESITGIVLDRAEQTENVAMLIRALMDEDRQTHLASFEHFKRKFADQILQRTLNTDKPDAPAAGPCSVLFCDLNHFKDYNTEFGQDTTDHILTAIAHTLKSFTRQKKRASPTGSSESIQASDFVARRNSAGDEFLILMPGASAGKANERMKAIRDKIKDTVFIVKDKKGDYRQLTNVTLASGAYEMNFPLEETFEAPPQPPLLPEGEPITDSRRYYAALEYSMDIAADFIDRAEIMMAQDKKDMKINASADTLEGTKPHVTRISYDQAMALKAEKNVVFIDASPQRVTMERA